MDTQDIAKNPLASILMLAGLGILIAFVAPEGQGWGWFRGCITTLLTLGLIGLVWAWSKDLVTIVTGWIASLIVGAAAGVVIYWIVGMQLPAWAFGLNAVTTVAQNNPIPPEKLTPSVQAVETLQLAGKALLFAFFLIGAKYRKNMVGVLVGVAIISALFWGWAALMPEDSKQQAKLLTLSLQDEEQQRVVEASRRELELEANRLARKAEATALGVSYEAASKDAKDNIEEANNGNLPPLAAAVQIESDRVVAKEVANAPYGVRRATYRLTDAFAAVGFVERGGTFQPLRVEEDQEARVMSKRHDEKWLTISPWSKNRFKVAYDRGQLNYIVLILLGLIALLVLARKRKSWLGGVGVIGIAALSVWMIPDSWGRSTITGPEGSVPLSESHLQHLQEQGFQLPIFPNEPIGAMMVSECEVGTHQYDESCQHVLVGAPQQVGQTFTSRCKADSGVCELYVHANRVHRLDSNERGAAAVIVPKGSDGFYVALVKTQPPVQYNGQCLFEEPGDEPTFDRDGVRICPMPKGLYELGDATKKIRAATVAPSPPTTLEVVPADD